MRLDWQRDPLYSCWKEQFHSIELWGSKHNRPCDFEICYQTFTHQG